MAYPDKFVENIDTAKLFKEQQSSTLSQVKSELNQPNIAGNVAGVGLEVGTGYATDLVTAGLLNPGTIYATGGASILAYGAANFTSGALSNYAAQRLRGEEEISWGEIISSGLIDIIPFFGQKIKGAKGITNVALQAGAKTVAQRQGEEAIDEQRWLTPRETLEAALIGGAFGGMFKGVGQGHAYWRANYKKYDLLEADKLFPPEAVQALIKAGRIRKTPRDFQAYMFKMKDELGGNYKNRPAPINVDENSFKEISKQLDKVAKRFGYKSPSLKTVIKLLRKGGTPIPQDIKSLYQAHQEAFWNHIERQMDNDPSLNLNMEIFPSLIFKGEIYRPKSYTRLGKRGFTTELETSRVQHHKKGKSFRKGREKALDAQTEYTAKDFYAQKPEELEKWNVFYRARGAKELQPEELTMDHYFPIEMTENYGKGLSSRNQNIVYNEIKRAGGKLGNDPTNALGLENSINVKKNARLAASLKKLNHKPASQFGDNQDARVKYYLTPHKTRGKTPIEEFIEEVQKANDWAMSEMLNLVNKAPVIKPGIVKNLPKEEYDQLVEIFGEDGVKTLANRLYEWAQEGLEEWQLKELMLEEIILKQRGEYPYN
tara:strand:- start:47 stop:1846 length:1800 start_codon:yes stop_codon:yes gene_type:complete